MFYVNSLPDSGDICFDHILSLQFAHVVNNFVVKVSVMSWLWCCRSSTVVVAKQAEKLKSREIKRWRLMMKVVMKVVMKAVVKVAMKVWWKCDEGMMKVVVKVID